MKRFSLCLIALIAATWSFSTVYAQTDPGEVAAQAGLDRPFVEPYSFDLTGAGARAIGMGGAFIGTANDVTSVGWNPAGLVTLQDPIMGVTYTGISPAGEYDFAGAGPLAPARTFDQGDAFGGISSANFAAPLRIKGHEFIGSIGLTRHSSEYDSFGFAASIDSVLFFDTLRLTRSVNSQLEGSISSVNFGFGTRMYKNISAGLSVNVFMGETIRSLTIRDQADDIMLPNTFGQTVDAEATADIIDTNSWSGFNFTVGGKIDGERLDAGLVVRTPFSLKSQTTRSVFNILKLNGLNEDDGTDTTYFINMQVEYQMPLMVGAGLAYDLNEQTTLALDVEYRNFSSSAADVRDSLIINPDGSNEDFTTEDTTVEWNSVFTVRAGGEHLLQTGFGSVPVRAGFALVPYPNPAITIDQSTLNLNESTPIEYRFSVGTGIWWSQIKFDLAYTFATMSREDVMGELNNKSHRFSLGFTGVF